AQADAVAARAGDATCRRTDFRRNDFHRPHAVAHARGDGPERLAATLRPLAGVAYDLDHVLLERDRGFLSRRRAPLARLPGHGFGKGDFGHGDGSWLSRVVPARRRGCARNFAP